MRVHLHHPQGHPCFVTDRWPAFPGKWVLVIDSCGIGPPQESCVAAIRHGEHYIRTALHSRQRQLKEQAQEVERLLRSLEQQGQGWLKPFGIEPAMVTGGDVFEELAQPLSGQAGYRCKDCGGPLCADDICVAALMMETEDNGAD